MVGGCVVRSDNWLGQVEANRHYSPPDSMPGKPWKHVASPQPTSRVARQYICGCGRTSCSKVTSTSKI